MHSEILKLSFRNIRRHTAKYLFVGVMIFLVTTMFLFTSSGARSSEASWRKYFSETFLGYYNVSAFRDLEKDYTVSVFRFPDKFIPQSMTDYLDTNKVAYSKRIKLGGLIYNEEALEFDGRILVCLIASDFEKESKYLTNIRFVEGGYDPKVDNGVVVWRELAKTFGWKLGDEVTFYLKDVDNQSFPYTFKITGIATNRWGETMEGRGDVPVFPTAFVKYTYLAKALGADGGVATELAIWDRADLHTSVIKKLAGKNDLDFFYAEGGYQAITGIVQFIAFIGHFIAFFILLILAVSSLNINLMSFFERQKEIGSIIAMGAKPDWVIKLLVTEMVLFSTIAFGVSLAFNLLIYAYASKNGLDFGDVNVAFAGLHHRPEFVISSIVTTYLIILGTMLISTAYPIYLTRKINPVEIFRDSEI